jgi:hypothetical protein
MTDPGSPESYRPYTPIDLSSIPEELLAPETETVKDQKKRKRDEKSLETASVGQWPLFSIDDVPANKFFAQDRVISQIILPAGKLGVKTPSGDKTVDTADIEVYLTGDIAYRIPDAPLLGEQGIVYRIEPKSVEVVLPTGYQELTQAFHQAVTETFVPEKKIFNVPIVYWLCVWNDLLTASIFITRASKSAQDVQDDIGKEKRDLSTRLAEYSVPAIKRITNKRIKGRNSQVSLKGKIRTDEGGRYEVKSELEIQFEKAKDRIAKETRKRLDQHFEDPYGSLIKRRDRDPLSSLLSI